MKKGMSLFLAFLLTVGLISAVPMVYADATPTLNITGGLDLTAYAQNAMRVYFSENITNSTTNGTTMVNVQAMAPTDANYDEAVVNGVLDGIIIDGKTVRQWNTSSSYGVMVHYYLADGENFIAVYVDAGLVNFADGNAHIVAVNSKFKAYSLKETNGASLTFNPATLLWTTTKLAVTSGLDLTAYDQNAMRAYFDKNVTNKASTEPAITMTNIQAIATTDADYDRTVVEGVLDGISIDGTTVREWNTSNSYGVMIHFFIDNGQYFAAVYADPTLVDFADGLPHTVAFNSKFKGYSMESAIDTTLYLNPETMIWSTTAPLPTMNVTGGESRPTFDWGNTMRVLFDQAVWTPAPDAVSPESDLLVDAQNLIPSDKYYNADAVNSILNKIVIDGKTVAEWNALQAGTAQVHVGPSENDIRIYMQETSVAFGDGDTHIVTIEKNFISFTGYKTEEAVSLNYDPTAKTWGTEVVVPPTPAPGEPVESFTAAPLLMSSNYGTAYFYMTNVITRVNTINVQAGGGNIPTEVQNAVLDLIKIDGKTVCEWNAENESNYSVMVAFETEQNGEDTFGRLSIWVDTTGSFQFIPTTDHLVEFLPGLIGLNQAPIAPATWRYVAADMEWYLGALVADPTPTTEGTNDNPTVTVANSTGESPTTSDNGFMFIYLFAILAISPMAFIIKKKSLSRK